MFKYCVCCYKTYKKTPDCLCSGDYIPNTLTKFTKRQRKISVNKKIKYIVVDKDKNSLFSGSSLHDLAINMKESYGVAEYLKKNEGKYVESRKGPRMLVSAKKYLQYLK